MNKIKLNTYINYDIISLNEQKPMFLSVLLPWETLRENCENMIDLKKYN
jgi:hypothetical protein